MHQIIPSVAGMPRRRPRPQVVLEEEDWGDGEEEGERPQQRNAANARERARMRVLSRAFCRLKTTLPWVPADTKLSKLDTLRLATSYIAHLRSVLRLDQDDPPTIHPLNLVCISFKSKHSQRVTNSNQVVVIVKTKKTQKKVLVQTSHENIIGTF